MFFSFVLLFVIATEAAKAPKYTRTLDLFGGDFKWEPKQLVVLSDHYSGGKSVGSVSSSPDNTALVFSGSIEATSTHKGFVALSGTRENASELSATPPLWDFSAWDGLSVTIRKSDGKKYSLNLRTTTGDVEGDQVDYKYLFETEANHPTTHTGLWKDFVPMVKGKKVKAAKLDVTRVKSILIMCSSLLGEQNGDFNLVVGEVKAVKVEGSAEKPHSEL
ncbi:hypothetical protein HDU97_007990 [Phlyctochytrium planicorne]|nr:hypothetical protein HDU97_007990 [Phlyctochytrium planicorne]